ncbi:MAG: hypothetical protein ABIJ21_06230 [Nanoarchaeota archaeon]
MAKGTSTGSWAFLIGVILALIIGIVGHYTQTPTWLGIVLVLLGLIVGLMNVTAKEAHSFMIAGAILVIVAAQAGSVFMGVWAFQEILTAILMLFTPAVVITAIKEVWGMAKN